MLVFILESADPNGISNPSEAPLMAKFAKLVRLYSGEFIKEKTCQMSEARLDCGAV